MRQLTNGRLNRRHVPRGTEVGTGRGPGRTLRLLNHLSGAALILAGAIWTVGFAIIVTNDDGTPIKGIAVVGALFVVPVLLLVGFTCLWLEGRRTGRSSRVAAVASVLPIAGSIVALATAVNESIQDSGPHWIAFMWGLFLFVTSLGIAALLLTISGRLPRWSTLPLILVGISTVVGLITGPLLLNVVQIPAISAAIIVFAFGAGLILLGTRLWSVDLIINRALVYGILTACILGLYALAVGASTTIMQGHADRITFLIAIGLIAVLFHPVRQGLQWIVNHLMYGNRDDPYTVLSHLGQRLGGTVQPSALLSALVETTAQALRLPYAALALQEGGHLAVVASVGSAPSREPVRVPIAHRGERVGELVLAPRSGERSFSSGERRLLHDLAQQAGIAVHSVQLAMDLQRSRETWVTLREEERRRLRRDLHDGLGPALASVMLKVSAARRVIQADSPAEPMLREARSEMQEVIATIRQLVYDLRPPALDDLGLVGAIEQTARAYEHDDLTIDVEVPKTLPALPAAVEVAAYRIVQEALTNVTRHADASATRVWVRQVDGAVTIEVANDGTPAVGGNNGTSGNGLRAVCESARRHSGGRSRPRR